MRKQQIGANAKLVHQLVSHVERQRTPLLFLRTTPDYIQTIDQTVYLLIKINITECHAGPVWGEPERESSEQLDTKCSVLRRQLWLSNEQQYLGQSSKISIKMSSSLLGPGEGAIYYAVCDGVKACHHFHLTIL